MVMSWKAIYTTTGRTRYYVDGVPVTEEEFFANSRTNVEELLSCRQPPGGHSSSCWPMRSEALAVHPRQVEAANRRNKKAGIAVEYDPVTGEAIIPSRMERKKLLKLEGFYDKNGGYGD